jgi:hypothetical protein
MMMPPLNKKNQSTKNEEIIDANNDYNPLENLNRDETKEVKKFYEDQIESQKKMFNKLIDDEKKNNKI